MIADEKIGERGVKVRCKKCSNMIVVRPPSAEESAATATESQSGPSAEEPAPAGQMGGAFDAMFGDRAQTGLGQEESTQTYESQFGLDGQSVAQHAFGDTDEHAAGNGSGMPGGAGFDQDGADAFGFGATGQSGGETDFALGALEREPTGAGLPESSRPAGEKEWYVAIDDSQVGPIDLGEVEQRWDSRELDEDSLAWKAGMPDWLPIADVPELAYLITERPQSRPSVGAGFGNTAATLGGAASAGASVVSASFDSAEGPAIEWKPSAASALSSLVEEEIVAPSHDPSPPQPAATPQPALEGMPSFGASDVFGGNGADHPAVGLGAPAPSAPLAGDVGGWSVPESRPSGGGNGVLIALVALVLVLVAAVGGGAYYFLVLKPGQGPSDPATPPSGPVVAQKDDPQAGEAEKPAESEKDEPEKLAAVTDDSKSGEPATADAPEPASRPESQARPDRNKPRPERSKPRPSRTKPKGGGVDDVFDKPAPSKNLPALTKDDIVDGVKSNGGKLKPCLTAARAKGEILPGKYKFILNWRIQPSGGVSNASLSGPSEVMGTSLPRCFSRVMSSWKFKPSKSGAPIKNFPLPITVR